MEGTLSLLALVQELHLILYPELFFSSWKVTLSGLALLAIMEKHGTDLTSCWKQEKTGENVWNNYFQTLDKRQHRIMMTEKKETFGLANRMAVASMSCKGRGVHGVWSGWSCGKEFQRGKNVTEKSFRNLTMSTLDSLAKWQSAQTQDAIL